MRSSILLVAVSTAISGCQGTLSGARGTLSPADKSSASIQYSDSPALYAYVCKPAGPGPFPAVIYHHGTRNGDTRGTCEALANAGFVGVAPRRRSSIRMRGQMIDFRRSIGFTRRLKYVQPHRIGILGFSRGALLGVLAATRGGNFKAMALLAPAAGRGHLERAFENVSSVRSSTLILVAENDQAFRRGREVNRTQLSRQLKSALDRAGRPARLIVYPRYGSDGHRLFYRVRSQYWNDVIGFFRSRL